jgi:arylsulfatase A-like enzyme
VLAAGAVFAVLGALVNVVHAKPAPNIVVVYVDDAGYADFPFYSDDHPRTPNIDQLCREGVRFTQFYVNAPICSPSRVAITTGQYPSRWGVTTFIASREENAKRGIPNWLDPAAPSLARMLKSAGYATGHFGKWHLGGGRDVGEAPLISEYGFDASLTQFEGLGDRVLPLLNNYDGRRPRKLPLGVASEQLGRGNVEWANRSRITGRFVAGAVEFMKQAQSSGKPFYVNVWPDDVHTPLHPPKRLRGNATKRELYLGVLENMDRQLAALFDHIRNDEALSNNTIILVASDNGFEGGAGSGGDLRGSKGALYEGGVREPLIVWAPGLMEPAAVGTTNDRTVLSSIDVVPSLLAIAEVSAPTDITLDGEDLSDSLLGRAKQTRKTPLYWVRPPDRPGRDGEDFPDLAIREGRWKLLLEFDGTNPELFDVAADPNETRSLADDHKEVVRELSAKLLAWHGETRATGVTALSNVTPATLPASAAE